MPNVRQTLNVNLLSKLRQAQAIGKPNVRSDYEQEIIEYLFDKLDLKELLEFIHDGSIEVKALSNLLPFLYKCLEPECVYDSLESYKLDQDISYGVALSHQDHSHYVVYVYKED